MSFLFVDRITQLSERQARGVVALEAAAEPFPVCFAAEAIGQLAAWVAIQRAEFAARPVAARVGEVRLLREAPRGGVLELGVEIASVKRIAIAYGGWARASGESIVELYNSVGVILPMEEFDAPENAREQLALLLGAGFPRRAFPRPAAYEPQTEIRVLEPARLEATLRIPDAAELYADHFPRRPVYPATLLLDAQLRLAKKLVATDAVRASVRDVKVRAFSAPGATLEVVAERRAKAPDGSTQVALKATSGGQPISTALVVFP